MNEEIKSKKLRLLGSLCSGHASHTRFWTGESGVLKPCLGFPAALEEYRANRKEMSDRGESPRGKL